MVTASFVVKHNFAPSFTNKTCNSEVTGDGSNTNYQSDQWDAWNYKYSIGMSCMLPRIAISEQTILFKYHWRGTLVATVNISVYLSEWCTGKKNEVWQRTHYWFSGSFWLSLSKTFISSMAASLYLSTFFIIFRAMWVFSLQPNT